MFKSGKKKQSHPNPQSTLFLPFIELAICLLDTHLSHQATTARDSESAYFLLVCGLGTQECLSKLLAKEWD